MLILLNSTKTMDLTARVPSHLVPTEPAHLEIARQLAGPLKKMSLTRLGNLLDVKGKLADQTRADLALWGKPGRLHKPALLAFSGLVYKYLDPPTLKTVSWKRAQNSMRILSGLYGLLRPLDEVEAYRLEMGSKVKPRRAKNLTEFWRPRLTAAVNAELKSGEPIINLAAQEYMKALEVNKLVGPVISPVFKERLPTGKLRTAPVHAKMARGALARYVLVSGAKTPRDLLGFGELGWEPEDQPPADGPWLFTRPYRR